MIFSLSSCDKLLFTYFSTSSFDAEPLKKESKLFSIIITPKGNFIMRILVVSDSHDDPYTLGRIIRIQTTAEVVVFLGDGARDIDECRKYLENKHLIQVRGNRDSLTDAEVNVVQTIEGKKYFITHGYLENVKFGIDNLIYKGQELGADIILYGHTHIPVSKYIDGVYVFNPGSVRDGNYGFIDITPKGEVMCVNAHI